MIISKKNKIILITPPKTGTHSITNYLSGVISDKSLPINQVGYPIYHLTISEICYVFNINQLELKEYNPHINKNQTPTDYNKLYNKNCISIVSELYKNDLKYFNYEF